MALTSLIYVVIALLTIFYGYTRFAYSYWDRKGFKTHPGVSYLFGHFKPLFFQKENAGVILQNIYKTSSEPFVGLYGIFKPMLLVRDPSVIRNILIKDFSNFTDRGVHCDEKNDPISAHLFALSGEKWKNLRSKLTPTFTSGKLKAMFSTLVNSGKTVENFLEKEVKNNKLIDIRELSASMATNTIASVGFGVDVDTINNSNDDFRKYGRQIFELNFLNGLRGFINFTAPKLMRFMPFKSVDREVEDFIFAVVRKNLEYREKNHVTRKDFFQLLVQVSSIRKFNSNRELFKLFSTKFLAT